MVAISKEMKELIGEHEAIIAHMKSLTRSAASLAARPDCSREQLWSYRQRLYDFKDAIWYHLEIDERIFKSLFGGSYADDPIEEHREIQQLVNDMILLADSAAIDNLEQAELSHYCASLEKAFSKICRLIELHIAKENAILGRVQDALNHH